jgi:dihydrofolate synthase / folylpolyglutamate synthase
MKSSDYQAALQYLYSFVDYEKLPGAAPPVRTLNLVTGLLEKLGNPESRWPSVHVTGTKGKGSTATMIANIAAESGYRVGLYTSPHLLSYRERMVINGRKIPKGVFCELVEKARPVLDTYLRDSAEPPSFFDVWTALAFVYFAESQVDLAVVEVGLGGRLDSTNVLMPDAAVITPIGLDHTDRLGSTIREIAIEKAGIVKQSVPTISAPQVVEAQSVILDTCQSLDSRLIQVGTDIQFSREGTHSSGQVFSVNDSRSEYRNLVLGLRGAYQIENAVTAIATVEALNEGRIPIAPKAVGRALKDVNMPGRLQVIQQNPTILMDGAHNTLAIRTLVQSLDDLYPHRRVIFVLSLNQDKDVDGMCRILSAAGDEFIVANRRIVHKRQVNPETVATRLRLSGKPVAVTEGVAEALDLSRAKAGVKDLVCVTGSLYLVGEMLEIFHDMEPEETFSRDI